VFVSCEPWQPSSMFAGEVGANPSGATAKH
jgi:hypothetical protein